MKKIAFALAATALCGTAAAQSSVTLYGLIDDAVEYRTHAAATGSKLLMTTGGMNTSRFGLRGAEDLGGGLKAVFQLENEFYADNGGTPAGLIFGRQANVGLEGSFGRVVAGRSYTTAYDFMLPLDPMGYAPNYSWVTSAGATGARKDGMKSSADNLIKYQGNFSGFKVGATYSFGEVANAYSQNSAYVLGLGYENGPLNTAVTYDRTNSNAAPYNKTTSVNGGISYDFNPVKVFLGGRYYKQQLASGAPDLRSNTFWGGVQYQATQALRLTGVAYYQDIKNVAAGTDADPLMLVLQARYALSKRTDLYAVGAYAKAKNSQLTGVSRDDVAFGQNQTGVSLGIQHRF